MGEQEKKSPQELFRDSLEDLITIAGALAPHCENMKDLVGLLELAMTNDGQLSILMSLVKTTRAKK